MTPLRLKFLVAALLLAALVSAPTPGTKPKIDHRASTTTAPAVVERPHHLPRASRSRRTTAPPSPTVIKPKARPVRTTPRPPVVDPRGARAVALSMLVARGWSMGQFGCLDALWGGRESGWRTDAGRTSGPYGIPQANPGTKMASAGADWRTSARTQIAWGLGYIAGRYGTPCAALGHSRATRWY